MQADGVFSGGGVKGIAFAGALRAAEEAGYDAWDEVAGTSAGAIVAMTLATGYDSAGIRSALESTDLSEIADYGGIFGRIRNVLRRRGLTRGQALQQWIEDLLANAPRPATKFGELETHLEVVGVDLAHSRLVVFPRDVELYEDDNGRPLVPDDYPIADAVRISAGYPFFFPPLTLRDHVTKKEGVLVDGGVSSAFPVFLFDKPNPEHPTWGFRLFSGFGRERPSYREISGLDWPVEMAAGVVDTAMNAFDKRELLDFGDRAIGIPTGDVNTLDFKLSQEDRDFLYTSGLETGRAFFKSHPVALNRFGERPPVAKS